MAAAELTGVFLDRVDGKKHKMAGAAADGKMAARGLLGRLPLGRPAPRGEAGPSRSAVGTSGQVASAAGRFRQARPGAARG